MPVLGALSVRLSEPKLSARLDGSELSADSQLVKPVSVGAPERVKLTLRVAAWADVAAQARKRNTLRCFIVCGCLELRTAFGICNDDNF